MEIYASMGELERRFLDTASSDYGLEESDDYFSSQSSDVPKLCASKHEKTKKENEKLRNWLKTRRTLTNTPNNLLLSCTNAVINDVFGGLNNILRLLVNNANNTQLMQINQIIKSINDKNKKKLKLKNKVMDIDKEEKSIETKNNFNIIPSECISYITSFLNKDGDAFEHFKLVSRRISICCLEEMLKFRIGICDMNEFILFNTHKKNRYRFDEFECIKYYRYNPKRTVQHLQEQWSKHYNIDENKQLVFPLCDNIRITRKKYRKYRNIIRSQQKILNFIDFREFTTFLLFDTRNMVYINNNKKQLEVEKEVANNLDNNNNHLIILKYFDIFKQSVDCIQFVMIDKDITYHDIMQYIEHQFVARNDKQKEFYESIKEYIDKMRMLSTNEAMLAIYHSITYDHVGHQKWDKVDDKVLNKSICSLFKYNIIKELIFQLNPEHRWMFKYREESISIHPIEFCAFEQYLDTLRSVRIQSKVGIKELKLLISSFNTGTAAKYIDDFNPLYNGKEYDNLDRNVTFGELRQMISNDISDGTVDCRQIELFDHSTGYDQKLCPCHWNDRIRSETFKFELVTYDVSTINHITHRVYKINIYLPGNGPFPFYANIKTPVTILYPKTFLVKDIARYIFDDIINKALYKHQLKDISDIYNKNKNNLDFILNYNEYYNIMDEYKDDGDEDSDDGNDVSLVGLPPVMIEADLFMIMRPNDFRNNNTFLITIHFIKHHISTQTLTHLQKYHYTIYKSKMFVGLPLEIRVDKNENKNNCLRDIINSNMYINKFKQYIHQTTAYKVGDNDQIIDIDLDNYKILQNEVILLKLLQMHATLTSKSFVHIQYKKSN